jgi:hypothetical protein
LELTIELRVVPQAIADAVPCAVGLAISDITGLKCPMPPFDPTKLGIAIGFVWQVGTKEKRPGALLHRASRVS